MKRYEKCILATCPVPWDENYDFSEGIFRDQLRLISGNGTKHIYIFGTAGEGYAVTDSQFARITEVFSDEIRRFFVEICGRFYDCSFLHYNNLRSKRTITPDEYALLVDEFPNLVATKKGGRI